MVVMVGVEYLEIIPSVKPITDMSSGTFKLFFAAILIAVTANNSLTAKIASHFWDLIKFSIFIEQFSMSSILIIKSSLTSILFNFSAFFYSSVLNFPTLT